MEMWELAPQRTRSEIVFICQTDDKINNDNNIKGVKVLLKMSTNEY